MTFADASNQGQLCCAGPQSNFYIFPVFLTVAPVSPLAAVVTSGSSNSTPSQPSDNIVFSHSSNSQGTINNSPVTTDTASTTNIASTTAQEESASVNQSESDLSSTILPTDVTSTKLIEASVIGNSNPDLISSNSYKTNRRLSLDATSSTGGSTFSLESGNALFSPANDMQVETPEGTVQIPQGAFALVMANGDDLAIYDLHDSFSAGIKVTAGKKEISLSPGTQVVLTRSGRHTFDEVNPGSVIACRQIKSFDVGGNMKAFTCEFSLTSAIASVRPLQQMLTSSNPRHRKLVALLIKNAAILSQIGSSHGPYKAHEVANSETTDHPLSGN